MYVLDSQKEDNDAGIFHWLNVVKANGGDSPTIVVVNKRDLNSTYQFDLNRYKKMGFNIVDVLYLSAANGSNCAQSIDDLIASISTHVKTLQDIQFPLPPSWKAVKQEVESFQAQDVDFIESNEYEKLCDKHGIENTHLQNTLLTILNQIGTIVTYRNNKRLREMQIINPLWVTNGVYKIVRSTAIDNTGVLSEDQFHSIFANDNKYKERHFTWLLDLLNQFELSFSIGEAQVLIPSKLSPNQPDFDLSDFQQGLNFRYSYRDILKKSVISLFIVKMKDYASADADPKYWQRGVFLTHHDANAVVIADEQQKTITISIDTNTRAAKDLLSIIRHTIREINGEKLKVAEEVPLVLDSKIVGFARYKLLVDAERDKDEIIRLEIEGEERDSHKFTIAELLDGYRYEKNPSFNYRQLGEDLITIALIETESRHAIFAEKEDLTNDRFRNALFHKGYNICDQSRGGESGSGKSSGERDLIVRNNKTRVAESVIEGLQLKGDDSAVIEGHYEKLTTKYDTVGNKSNIMLVYAKVKDFAGLWDKYQAHFEEFDDTSDDLDTKDSIRYGLTTVGNMTVFHLFVNFYSNQ